MRTEVANNKKKENKTIGKKKRKRKKSDVRRIRTFYHRISTPSNHPTYIHSTLYTLHSCANHTERINLLNFY